MAAISPNTFPNTSLNTTTGAPVLSGLARSLLQAGRVTAAQAESCSKRAASEKISLIDALLQDKAVDSRSLAIFCSETFGYPLLDFAAFNFGSMPDKVIDAKLMQSQRVLALGKRGNRLSVALSDPTNTQALEQIKFQTEMTVEPIIVDHLQLVSAIEKLTQSAEQ